MKLTGQDILTAVAHYSMSHNSRPVSKCVAKANIAAGRRFRAQALSHLGFAGCLVDSEVNISATHFAKQLKLCGRDGEVIHDWGAT